MLVTAERKRQIRGTWVANWAPAITNLFFANDSLLVCRANVKEWKHILNILNEYAAASRQILNQNKTPVLFDTNTRKEVQQQLLTIARIT